MVDDIFEYLDSTLQELENYLFYKGPNTDPWGAPESNPYLPTGARKYIFL